METDLNLITSGRHGPITALPPHMDPYRQKQGTFLQKRNGAKGVPSPLRHSMTHFAWESEDEDDPMDIDPEPITGSYMSQRVSSTPPSSPSKRPRTSSPLARGFNLDPMVAEAIQDFNQIVSDVLRKRKVPSALKRLRMCISTINHRILYLSGMLRDDGLSSSMERELDFLTVEIEGLSNLFKQVKPSLKRRT